MSELKEKLHGGADKAQTEMADQMKAMKDEELMELEATVGSKRLTASQGCARAGTTLGPAMLIYGLKGSSSKIQSVRLQSGSGSGRGLKIQSGGASSRAS